MIFVMTCCISNFYYDHSMPSIFVFKYYVIDHRLLVVGGHQGSNLAKDTRNPVQATEPGSKEKIEL